MTEEESQALDAEIAAAEESASAAEQFVLIAREAERVLEQPHEPGDQERYEYLDTLLTELRKTRQRI